MGHFVQIVSVFEFTKTVEQKYFIFAVNETNAVCAYI